MIGSRALSRIVGKYLELNGMTVEQALTTMDESQKKAGTEAIRAKLELFNHEWEAKTDLCLEFVLDSFVPWTNRIYSRLTNETPLESHQSPARAMKNSQEDAIETYRFLSCPICTTHDCCFHGMNIRRYF
jgi:hypothetical protein